MNKKTNMLSRGWLYLLVGIMFLCALSTLVYIRMTGIALYRISSESMTPALVKGDVILDRKTKPEDIQVGDVITYDNPDYSITVTHRVINVENREGQYIFHVQGDANTIEDNVDITNDMVHGKVVAVFKESDFGIFKFIAVVFLMEIALILLLPFALLVWRHEKQIEVEKEFKEWIYKD